MFERFEEFTADVIYDRREEGLAVRFFGRLLRILSYLFEFIVRIRHFLYKKRIFRNQPLGCLVVVVGNLTVGGTGKTPIVEKIARILTQRGRKVAVLSRGYKSKPERMMKRFYRWLTHGETPPPKIVSDGETVLLNSEEGGDEPYMLARNLPGVVVLVDKNRVKAGAYAIKHFGVDTLILDDGFQYMPLKGQLNLLLVDKTNPFGNCRLLPRGILREPVQHLARASYIFLTKSDGKRDLDLERTLKQHNPHAEIIECSHSPKFLQEVNGDDIRPLDFLSGKWVAALSAIASPAGFEGFLKDSGAQLAYSKRFMDHHRFTPWELELFAKDVLNKKVDCIITTEKDAVRIPQDYNPGVPIYYLRLEVEILSGQEDFEEAASRICIPSEDSRAVRKEPELAPVS